MASNDIHSIQTDRDSISPDLVNGPPIPIDEWPDNPLLATIHPRHKNYIHTNHDSKIAIPLNKPFDLESKAFKGTGIIRIVDMPTSDKKYFHGRRRKSEITTQGTFKRRIRFDHVFTGQLFDRPFRHLPTPYLISAGLKIIQTLAPSLKANIDTDKPHMMSPWASACQIFNICKVGDEAPMSEEVQENLEILGPKFKGMTSIQRKSLFHDLKELERYYFEPGYVYTMSFYSHMFAPMTYSLHMLKMKWGIQSYIPAPMQINAIILPEGDDVNIIPNSCDDLVGDVSINDKLIDEILKEKSQSMDVQDDPNATQSTIDYANANTKNKNKNKNSENKNNNNDNENLNETKANDNDTPNDDSSSSTDDVPKTGRERNPAVDSPMDETTLNNNPNNNKNKETNNNENLDNKHNETNVTTSTTLNGDSVDNKNNNNNNNTNENNEDNSENDEKDNTGPTAKSLSQMTVDEKIQVVDLLDCEFIYSFSIWHVKLVDELYGGKYSIHTKKKFGKKSKNDTNKSNTQEINTNDIQDSTLTNDNSTATTEEASEKSRKGSLLGMFGKKW